jgi:hypothetical protein
VEFIYIKSSTSNDLEIIPSTFNISLAGNLLQFPCCMHAPSELGTCLNSSQHSVEIGVCCHSATQHQTPICSKRYKTDSIDQTPTNYDQECAKLCIMSETKVHWQNRLIFLKGQYDGKDKFASIGLEAVAENNLWFWHAAFGFPGTLSGINIWGTVFTL